ncbi:MAG: tetratricopeptide repeat protein [Bacteroidales bacterium]
MKRLILAGVAVILCSLGYAQPVKLQSAINYLNDLRLDEAKENIHEALEHEKTKNDPKTWYYKGRIYMSIYIISTMDDAIEEGMDRSKVKELLGDPAKNRRKRMEYEPDMVIYFDSDNKVESFNKPAEGAYEDLADEPLLTAYKAFQKTIELDEDDEYLNPVSQELMRLGNLFYNQAVNHYNTKEFEEAIGAFEKTYQIKKTFGETDTNSLFNAAVAATNAQKLDKALDLYKQLMQHNYQEPAIYTSAGEIYLRQEDTAKAENILKEGRERFPDDYNVLINLTNVYLAKGEIEKSTELLNLAMEKQPDNEQLYYNVAVVYEQSSKDSMLNEEKREDLFDRAVKNYKKAIELKEDYFDAIYNLGALYFNKGVELLSQANDLPLQAEDEYEALKDKANNQFENALPYLEKAHEMKPDDQNTLLALKELYTRTDQTEKLKDINAELNQ